MLLFVKILLIAGAAICAIAILVAAFRTGKPIRTLLSSAFGGVAALITVAATGSLTGAVLAINAWTLLCAAAAGIPGVVLMLALKLIWNI